MSGPPDLNYFRDFDPATGRYVGSAPIGLAGSQRMPREAMLYAYTRNAAAVLDMTDKIGSIAPQSLRVTDSSRPRSLSLSRRSRSCLWEPVSRAGSSVCRARQVRRFIEYFLAALPL